MILDLLAQAVDRFGLFWLIVGRVSGLFFLAPVFGNRFVPTQARVGLILLVSLVLLPVVPLPAAGVPGDLPSYAAAFARELAFGMAMGFLVALVFAVAEAAGQLLDVEMGFGLVNVIDPVFGQPLPIIGNFLHLTAILVYLLVDGHHLLLESLSESFARFPPGLARIGDGGVRVTVDEVAWMFLAAVKIAAPVLGVLFLTTVVLALVARAAPQLNVFLVGLPAKVAVGLAALALAMPAYVLALRALFPHAYEALQRLFGAVGAP